MLEVEREEIAVGIYSQVQLRRKGEVGGRPRKDRFGRCSTVEKWASGEEADAGNTGNREDEDYRNTVKEIN